MDPINYTEELNYTPAEFTEVPSETPKKPAFSDYQIFGLGYDVVFLAIAYTLAIGFIVKAIRDISEHVVVGGGKFDQLLHSFAKSDHLLPVIIGALTGPFVFDLMARLAGYDHMEFLASVYLGICAGALSSSVIAIVESQLKRFKRAKTVKLDAVKRHEGLNEEPK